MFHVEQNAQTNAHMKTTPSFRARLRALRKSPNIRAAERIVRNGWKGDGAQVGFLCRVAASFYGFEVGL